MKAPARSVLSIYSKAKLDSANAAHAELLALLSDFLGSYGHRVETNQFVDAFTRLKSGPAIFEAKSITDENELSQVRHGLSQLFEYRDRYGINDASLWLLLSRKPHEQWLIDYLETNREFTSCGWTVENSRGHPCTRFLRAALRRYRGGMRPSKATHLGVPLTHSTGDRKIARLANKVPATTNGGNMSWKDIGISMVTQASWLMKLAPISLGLRSKNAFSPVYLYTNASA